MTFTLVQLIVFVAIALFVGFAGGWLIRMFITESKVGSARRLAERIIEEAEKEAQARKKEALVEGKDEIFAERQKMEAEIKEWRQELQAQERKLSKREENLDGRMEALEKREKETAQKFREASALEETLTAKQAELGTALEEQKRQLERVAGLSREEAKKILLEALEEDVRKESALVIKRVQEETRETAKKRAQEILTSAIQKIATDHVSEVTVSSVPLPSDDLKGRIIGREGRNIRAFEAITGVNLIIDDTPDTVVLSGFEPVRRETARMTLDKLVSDGRIHPGRIEEVFSKVSKEMEDIIKEAGEQAAFDAGVTDLHPELLRLLGRLKFRTSYGQNVLKHTIEVAHLCGAMAAELGADVRVATRAGLLHDIGKAMTYEVGGTHALTGADVARRCGESEAVVHAIGAHHEEEEPKSIEAWIVHTGDAVSASRPGARRETIETYLRRLEALEDIAASFSGVEKSYAIHAGREIRILVEPEEIDDLEAIKLARDIGRRIEQEMEYPGQIKVTVVRETRAVEYAK